MSKLGAFVDLLRYGAEVADPERWKRGQINANTIVALLAAAVVLARAAGVNLPIDDAGIVAVAGGVFALANMVFTAVSSSRAGLLPAKVQPDSSGETVRTGPEQSPADNAVERYERDYPPDRGGGG